MPLSITKVFSAYVAQYPKDKQIILNTQKKIILKYILQNLNMADHTAFSQTELMKVATELQQSIYAVGHRLVDYIPFSDELDNPHNLKNNARNLAKHLILGTLAGKDGADIFKSPLAHPRNVDAVFKKHDPELLSALRIEFQHYLTKMAKPAVNSGVIAIDDDEKQFSVFIHSFLGLYPLLEPAHHETINIPKKLDNGLWTTVKYQFERIDISPQSGLIAALLVDEKDRMYAYGLTPISHPETHAYLLFSGTTFDVGQGARLATISNMTPGFSAGESHDMTLVEQWLSKQPRKVITSGQSQGAVGAIITAGKYPQWVEEAHALNPSALCKQTLGRLLPGWFAIEEKNRPKLLIYTQENDPIFAIEKGFFPGKNTHIYKLIPDTTELAINASVNSLVPAIIPDFFVKKLTPIIARAYEGHVHLYSGHRYLVMVELNIAHQNARLFREFSADAKLLISSLFYPVKKAKLLGYLLEKKYPVNERERKSIYTFVILVIIALINEGMKNPNIAKGICLLTALYLLIKPQIAGELAYRRALDEANAAAGEEVNAEFSLPR